MKIISEAYFPQYLNEKHIDITDALKNVQQRDIDDRSFTFYTSVAVISSSKIEGEQMDVDSYVKHTMQDIEYLPELTQKPNDLFLAYQFAGENELSEENFLQAHTILSQHLLPEAKRGAYRKVEMLVLEHNTGRIQYEAAPAAMVSNEMDKLWSDIAQLLERPLSDDEIFYYAAYIHLVFVNIHPFEDGNGRAGRLLEKWFLSRKIGDIAWFIQSEKYYYQHVSDYYQNLAIQGMFYEQLDYEKAGKFLQMLPTAINY
jgi:Fic family protein